MTEDEEIYQLFSNKYEQLYNSVPGDSNVFEKIKRKINERVLNERDANCCVCVEGVVNVVKHLKSGKSSGREGLNSDHLIKALHILIVILCQIFNIMIVHGMCRKSMLIGTMIPIPKVERQVMCKSENCRAIALSSIFGKVLDWIILVKEQKSFSTSNLQFGFKEGVSTTQCAYVVNETISYYNFLKHLIW